MKQIEVFLASSIVELEDERRVLGSFVGELNNVLIKKDYWIYLFKCEYSDASMTNRRKQDEYNEFIRERAEIFFGMFDKKLGEYTVEEYSVALEIQKKHPQLNICVCFKNHPGQKDIEEMADFKKIVQKNCTNTIIFSNDIDLKQFLVQSIQPYVPDLSFAYDDEKVIIDDDVVWFMQ